MGILLGDYTFEGPYTSTDQLYDRPNIYVIHTRIKEKFYVIDIGENSKIRNRIENHDQKECWQKNNKGVITFSVYYTPYYQYVDRKIIEKELREIYQPPCGMNK